MTARVVGTRFASASAVSLRCPPCDMLSSCSKKMSEGSQAVGRGRRTFSIH